MFIRSKILWVCCFLVIVAGLFSSKGGAQSLSSSYFANPLMSFYNKPDTAFQYYPELLNYNSLLQRIKNNLPYNKIDFFTSKNLVHAIENSEVFLQDIHYSGNIHYVNKSNFFFPYKVGVELNNVQSEALYYLNPASNTNDSGIAFLIIPGTDPVAATHIAIKNPFNYHNIPCNITDVCSHYGNVYTYVRPNLSNSQYWGTNDLGVRRGITDEMLKQITDSLNNNVMANSFIQIAGLIDHLQKKHTKVIVLGLSSGGWGALFSSFISTPEGLINAAGYSRLFHTQNWNYTASQMYFDSLFNIINDDSIRKIVNTSSTNYVFSYGKNDIVPILINEYNSKATKAYYGVNSNVSFNYHNGGHNFPCDTLDEFIEYIMAKPKAKLKLLSTCNSDSAEIQLTIYGKGPFSAQVFINDTFYTQINTTQKITNFFIKKFGEVSIKSLVGLNNTAGYASKTLIVNQSPKFIDELKIVDSSSVCNQDSLHIAVDANRFPIFMTYLNTQNNTITSKKINSQFDTLSLRKGNYVIMKTTDSIGCINNKNMNLNFSPNRQSIQVVNTKYNCTSNLQEVKFQLSGQLPSTIRYSASNQLFGVNLLGDTTITLLPDNYSIIDMTDAYGCITSINKPLNINDKELIFLDSSVVYSCNDSSYYLKIRAVGEGNVRLIYTYNGLLDSLSFVDSTINLKLSNGNYNFLKIKDKNCEVIINRPANINVKTPYYSLSNSEYNCSIKKGELVHTIGNNLPATVYYFNSSNIMDSFMIMHNNQYQFLSNGDYQFISYKDSFGCFYPINQFRNITYNPISVNMGNHQYNCQTNNSDQPISITGNFPVEFYYKKNGYNQSQTFLSQNNTLHLQNGNYEFMYISDVTGCIDSVLSQKYLSLQYDTFKASIYDPVYSCDSLVHQLDYALEGNEPFLINLLKDNISEQILTTDSIYRQQLGNHHYDIISISDLTGCEKAFNVSFDNYNDTTLISELKHNYDCDNLHEKMSLVATGNSPYTITYSKDSIPLTWIASPSSPDLILNNGKYEFYQLIDAKGCAFDILDTFELNNINFTSTLLPIQFINDSNKTKVTIINTGNPPYNLYFRVNNSPAQLTASSDTISLLLANNYYSFDSITDSKSCKVIIDTTFQFNFKQFTDPDFITYFVCDSNKQFLTINMTGSSPYQLIRSLNNTIDTIIIHSSPYTNYLDTGSYHFIKIIDSNGSQKILNKHLTVSHYKPALSITNRSYNCNNNLDIITLKTSGIKPLKLYLMQPNLDSILVNTDSISISLKSGYNKIIGLIDTNYCVSSLDTTIYNHNKPLSIHLQDSFFNCNTWEKNFRYKVSGNYPITIWYHNNITGNIYTKSVADSLLNISIPKGEFTIDSLADNKCKLTSTLQLINTIDTFKVSINDYKIDCNNGIYKIDIKPNGGKPPYKLEYLYNTSLVIKSGNNFTAFPMPNGNYKFTTIKDAHQCEIKIDSTYNPSYVKLVIDSIKQGSNCALSLPSINIYPNYNSSIALSAKLNNIPSIYNLAPGITELTLTNGTLELLSVTDTLGCITTMNNSIVLRYDTLKTVIDDVQKICSEKSFVQKITTKGHSPFLLYFNENNKFDSVAIDHNYNFETKYNNWMLHKIKDSKGCELSLDVHKNYPYYSPLNSIEIIEVNDTLRIVNSTGIYNYRWFNNNKVLNDFQYTWAPIMSYGDYKVIGKDSNDCTYESNVFTRPVENGFGVYPNPASTKVMITKPKAIQEIKIDILDMLGRTCMSTTSTNDVTHLEVGQLLKGIYIMRIQNTANNQLTSLKLDIIE